MKWFILHKGFERIEYKSPNLKTHFFYRKVIKSVLDDRFTKPWKKDIKHLWSRRLLRQRKKMYLKLVPFFHYRNRLGGGWLYKLIHQLKENKFLDNDFSDKLVHMQWMLGIGKIHVRFRSKYCLIIRRPKVLFGFRMLRFRGILKKIKPIWRQLMNKFVKRKKRKAYAKGRLKAYRRLLLLDNNVTKPNYFDKKKKLLRLVTKNMQRIYTIKRLYRFMKKVKSTTIFSINSKIKNTYKRKVRRIHFNFFIRRHKMKHLFIPLFRRFRIFRTRFKYYRRAFFFSRYHDTVSKTRFVCSPLTHSKSRVIINNRSRFDTQKLQLHRACLFLFMKYRTDPLIERLFFSIKAQMGNRTNVIDLKFNSIQQKMDVLIKHHNNISNKHKKKRIALIKRNLIHFINKNKVHIRLNLHRLSMSTIFKYFFFRLIINPRILSFRNRFWKSGRSKRYTYNILQKILCKRYKSNLQFNNAEFAPSTNGIDDVQEQLFLARRYSYRLNWWMRRLFAYRLPSYLSMKRKRIL